MMIFLGTRGEHHGNQGKGRGADKAKWVRMSQAILKAELKRRGIGYREWRKS